MDSEIYRKFSRRAVLQAVPMQASLELTYRCNERCTHCYIEDFRDDPQRVLGKEQWFRVLTELRKGGTLYLILMGGEPTLSPWFFDIIEKGRDLGFFVSAISNGLKMTQTEYVERMAESGMRQITFSLYSLNPEIHDKMTSVRGSHSKTMKAIELCHEQGIEVCLNGLLTEANSRGIFDLFDWAVERKFELKVDPNVTSKLNGNQSPTQYRATRETLLWFYRERAKRWPSSVPRANVEKNEDYICNAAKGKCAVTPYGDVLPCIEIRESFGNLVTQNFDDIWYSDAALKWRTPKIKDMKLNSREGIYSFCDHCPGMAKNEQNSPFELLPYTRLVAEVKRQVNQEFAGDL